MNTNDKRNSVLIHWPHAYHVGFAGGFLSCFAEVFLEIIPAYDNAVEKSSRSYMTLPTNSMNSRRHNIIIKLFLQYLNESNDIVTESKYLKVNNLGGVLLLHKNSKWFEKNDCLFTLKR
uniref:Uncharacterized protein n=1 Tax=Glossina brevipalpis TaxID=37001 RepID=A0A1A9WX85_9MUSC